MSLGLVLLEEKLFTKTQTPMPHNDIIKRHFTVQLKIEMN